MYFFHLNTSIMTINDLYDKADILDIKQIACIKGGSDITTQTNYIGSGDTDVF